MRTELLVCLIVVLFFTSIFIAKEIFRYVLENKGIYRTECFVVKRIKKRTTHFKYSCQLTKAGRKRFRNMQILVFGVTVEEALEEAKKAVRRKMKEPLY